MNFDKAVEKLLNELNAQTIHLQDSPSKDGTLPDGGNQFYGNINKNAPNQLLSKQASALFNRPTKKKNKNKIVK